ncbi:MAG: hypothetical protein JSS93_01660 [Bacteroidetes bacterium]|nr:hypothetical protein [Bacteroidota bacterium]
MKESFSFVSNFLRRVALCLALVYGALLLPTFLSSQDEITPSVFGAEFLTSDESLDQAPHFQLIRLCQAKLRTNIRPLGSLAFSKNVLPDFFFESVILKKISLEKKNYRLHDIPVLYCIFRI